MVSGLLLTSKLMRLLLFVRISDSNAGLLDKIYQLNIIESLSHVLHDTHFASGKRI